jgi:hypothetical protein
MQSNDCDSSARYCLVDASSAGKRTVKTASERRRSKIGNLVLHRYGRTHTAPNQRRSGA